MKQKEEKEDEQKGDPKEFVENLRVVRRKKMALEEQLVRDVQNAKMLLKVPDDWVLDMDKAHFRSQEKAK